MPTLDIDEIISWSDNDEDAKISFDEFIRIMTRLDISKDSKEKIEGLRLFERLETLNQRLETLTVDKNFPAFLHENESLFKFKAIVKLAKYNLKSIREDKPEDNLSDGSIWFVAAIHSVPADKQDECSQLISQFVTNGHKLLPRQNDEIIERLSSICGHSSTVFQAKTDEDVFKVFWSLDGIKSAEAIEQSRKLKKILSQS